MALVQCLNCEATWEVPDSAVPEDIKIWDEFVCEVACQNCDDGAMVALLEK